MAKKGYLQSLFKAHLADLKSVRPDIGDMFVCPICLRMFPEDSINGGFITDGHVWPTDMRKMSKTANDQSILLCRDCNNSAGSRGDAQMQLYEKLKLDEHGGELYGIRTVEIVVNPGEKPIRMRVRVRRNYDGTFTISGVLNKDNQWLGTRPEDQARFIELAKRSIESQQQFHVVINQPQQFKANLASAGWITSAYLMSFYTLGYRYILHQNFNFIREYIMSSFIPEKENSLALPEREDFHIETDESFDFSDPAIRINIPIGRSENIRLDVCFLKYIVCLPILLAPNIFEGYWSIMKKQLHGQHIPPAKEGDSPCVYDYVHCTKTIEHTCLYDYLLGKPVPKQ